MKPKTLYLALCIVGLILPSWQFLPWVLAHHGVPLGLFVRELFESHIGAFFGMDVLASALVLIVFMRVERRRLTVRQSWIPLIALVLVGVSLALPAFLYLREVALEGRARVDA